MGEAKRRGTTEQRKAGGIAKRNKQSAEREERKRRAWAEMSPESRQFYLMLLAMGAIR